MGEGKTSVSLEGGPFCGSLFQMALPQGKEEVLLEWPRPSVEAIGGPMLELHGSAAGDEGCELVVGNVPLPVNEGLRCDAC